MPTAVNIEEDVKRLVDLVCEQEGCTQISLCSTVLEKYCLKKLKMKVDPSHELRETKQYDPQYFKKLTKRFKKLKGSYSVNEVSEKLEISRADVFSILGWVIRKEDWEFESKKVIGDFLTVTLKTKDAIQLNKKVTKQFKIQI